MSKVIREFWESYTVLPLRGTASCFYSTSLLQRKELCDLLKLVSLFSCFWGKHVEENCKESMDIDSAKPEADKIVRLEGNRYQFFVGMDYDLDYSLRWYIYRNGSYHYVESGAGNHILEYAFTEPGLYTVSYYIRTQNGDYEYWIFPEIAIE